MPRLLPLVAAVLVALPACSLGSDDAVGITGTWEGTVTPNGASQTSFPIRLLLTDTGANVTGTGSVELPGERFEFRISDGAFIGTVVNLDLRFDMPPFIGGLDGTLTGTSPGQITGTFSGRDQVGDSRVSIELVDR